MRIGGVASLPNARVLFDFRDWTALSGGDDNTPSQRWDAVGRMQQGADSLYTQEGAGAPTLGYQAALGMRTYRMVTNNNDGGFFNNRHGIPLSRRYNNPALLLAAGAFGKLLRWSFRATVWTETPQANAETILGMISGNQRLAGSVDNTGYEVRAVNGGVWEVRRRLAMGGAIETFPLAGGVTALQPHTFAFVYTEGPTPLLQIMRDEIVAASFQGQAEMPALNTNLVLPAHMPRWHVNNTGLVNAADHLVGGQYLIEEQ